MTGSEFKTQDGLGRFLKTVSKSKFTEKDADLLSVKVKKSMHKKLKEKELK